METSAYDYQFASNRFFWHFCVIYIVGELHHILPVIEISFKYTHRLLVSGGILTFVELNADTRLNSIGIGSTK